MSARRKCGWQENSDGDWETECEHRMCFDDGGPGDNHFRYCPFCGGHLIATPFGIERPLDLEEDEP